MARYAYALVFLVANLLAWAARDYGHGALTEMESKFISFCSIVIYQLASQRFFQSRFLCLSYAILYLIWMHALCTYTRRIDWVLSNL